jgi:glycosyltransferase involved in cell wall biosynthesis
MRIAIVCDWLTTYGGAERVITEFTKLFPKAPIFTTVHQKGAIGPLDDADIHPSPLQTLYRMLGNHRLLAPFMPRAIESLDLRGFDVVLSSSHAIAKGCLPMQGALHICYCHTPMRYAWLMEEEYLRDFGLRGPLKTFARKRLMRLRRYDLTAAKRVDLFLANSTTTKERIEEIYGRGSVVLHPPVDDRFFSIGIRGQKAEGRKQRAESRDQIPEARKNSRPTSDVSPPLPYFLAVGRLVPYKRFDMLVEVANRLELPLNIIGEGKEERRLKRSAGRMVSFFGRVPDSDLPTLYAQAQAVLFPVEEDAGIVPLEAQACGTPVIAYGKGGACDTVIDGKTGVLFNEQSVGALTEALERFRSLSFHRDAIRAHARQFQASKFRSRLQSIIEHAYEQHLLKRSLHKLQTHTFRFASRRP